MTPLRQKEELQAELVGAEHLLSITPEDPLATPLLKGRIHSIKEQLSKLEENPPITPETELFFSQGPIIGTTGISVKFAADVLKTFQGMVTNHFSAKFFGKLRRVGVRKGESESTLFLTALPRGSFGLQLAQPCTTDFVTAGQLTQTMEEISDLVGAAAKDDESFVDTISHFNSRVLAPLTEFLKVLNNAESDCRIISGSRKTALKKNDVSEAYQRVIAARQKDEIVKSLGVFGGVLVNSGRFEFTPRGEKTITGWLAEEVSDTQAVEMDKLVLQECQAEIRVTTISVRTGKQTSSHELLSLTPTQPLPSTDE